MNSIRLDPPKFVDKITVEDRVSDSFWYIFLFDIAPNLDSSSEYDLKNFPNIFRSVYICNPVHVSTLFVMSQILFVMSPTMG